MLREAFRDARRLILPAAALLAVMVLLGFLVTKVLPGTAVGEWDASLPAELVDNREGGDVPESLILSTLSSTWTIVALTAASVVVLRLVFHRWRESFFVLFAVLGETLIFTLTALIVGRPRPEVPKLDVAPPTSGYPSGHTAAAICFYGAIAAIVIWHTRQRWLHLLMIVIAVAVPLAIGSSRVYRGMHHPTDVIAGVVLGAAWLAIVVHFVLTSGTGRSPTSVADVEVARRTTG